MKGALRAALAWTAALAAAGCAREPGPGSTPTLRLAEGATAPPFARATSVRSFRLPADHGPHFDYQTEWWYYTGNLTDASGRHFGYQLTFFRRGLSPGPPPEGEPAAEERELVTEVPAARIGQVARVVPPLGLVVEVRAVVRGQAKGADARRAGEGRGRGSLGEPKGGRGAGARLACAAGRGESRGPRQRGPERTFHRPPTLSVIDPPSYPSDTSE